jgi:uncharacterized protein YueI
MERIKTETNKRNNQVFISLEHLKMQYQLQVYIKIKKMHTKKRVLISPDHFETMLWIAGYF